ncbi:MAG: aminotransferase class I/II-fold pyridoxal phosphate-dependent enzyme, partial [Bacteroidota bacterium]
MPQTRNQERLDLVQKTVSHAVEAGVVYLHTEDEQLGGRFIKLDGKDLLHFGSCSYMGLEQNRAIKDATIDAVNLYGTQFSSSRAYVSLGMYEELEALLHQIYGQPTLVSASTTLGHMSNIPMLIEEGDAIILDHQVHASVQMAVQLMVAKGIKVEMIRHNRMDMLDARIKKLQQNHQRIWFMADGIYSMHGDLAPYAEMSELLERYEQLHLYVDDAHGISWTGKFGRGTAVSHFKGHPRVYITGSLNKSFAGGGGALIFPNEAIKQKVKMGGGTMIFSGPLQPPVLAACVASAKHHLKSSFEDEQKRFLHKIQATNRMIQQKNLYQPAIEDTPVFFIEVGMPDDTIELVKRLMSRGVFVNTGAYPSVPYRKSGVRFTIT